MPLLDVARAFSQQQHECVLLVPPSLADAAGRAGIAVVTGAEPSREFVDGIWARVRKGPPDRVAGLIDRELFAKRAADAMRDAAHALCAQVAPDLVVREPCEYATAMAAHDAGVAQAQVGISRAAIEAAVLEDVAAGLDRRCAGVVEAIRVAPYLTAFPAPLDPSPWRDTRRYRHAPSAGAPLPDWWPTMRARPLVYVTFGTVLGGLEEAHSVYRTALDAVAGLSIRALMTVGRRFDVDTLTPPSNTRVERWVAQADVLAAADLVVCHGGSGTPSSRIRPRTQDQSSGSARASSCAHTAARPAALRALTVTTPPLSRARSSRVCESRLIDTQRNTLPPRSRPLRLSAKYCGPSRRNDYPLPVCRRRRTQPPTVAPAGRRPGVEASDRRSLVDRGADSEAAVSVSTLSTAGTPPLRR